MKIKHENFLRNNYSIIFIFITGLILIIGPFFIRNNLEGFDTAGQIASVYYIRNYFWPWPSGWNSMLLAGFPQGVVYTPFFHWLSAAVSFVLPIKVAFKLLLSGAIISFPVVYLLLSKKVLKNGLIAGAGLLLASLFYYFDLGLNDNLFSDLYFGMAPHLFSVTLFFTYIYALYTFSEENKNWYWAGLLLALCIVTHVFTGTAAVLLGIIVLILSYKNANTFKNAIKHLILGAVLSVWWWLPFILNINYVSGSDNYSIVSPIILLLMPVILLVNLAAFLKNENNNTVLIKSLSIFSSLIIVAFLIAINHSIDSFPIHFSRFIIYSLLLTPILLLYVLTKIKLNWHKINLSLIFIFSFYFFFFKITPVGPFDTYILNNVKQYYENGRAIVTGGSRYLDDRFHITRTKLAVEAGIPTSEGLFVESSVSGWFIMSMMKSWENTVPTFVWAYKDLKDVADLSWGTKVFGVNYEYRINDRKPSSEEKDLLNKVDTSTSTKEIVKNEEKFDSLNEEKSEFVKALEKKEKSKQEFAEREERNLSFKLDRKKLTDDERIMSIFAEGETPFYYQSFYQINDTTIAEALSVRPIDINNNWRSLTQKWWSTNWLASTSTGVYTKPALVYRKNTKFWNLADRPTNLKVEDVGKKMDQFKVDATEFNKSVPIYVKVSYFPFWRAYDDSGKELEIYKTSPNFMLVYGKGMITFKYIEPWYYYFGFIVSGLGLLYLLFIAVKNFKK